MKPLRFLRTLARLRPSQSTARLRHELWLRRRRAIGWNSNESHRLSEAHLPLSEEALPRLRSLSELWTEGVVEHAGVRGDATDWLGEGKSKLWRYERHYHTELVALAARALEEPDGPWVLEARELQDAWAAACPPEQGDAWEPYPTARRILSWAEAAALCPQVASTQMAPRLALQLRHLAAHLEHHLRGNHLLCDAAALLAGGAMLAGPEGEAALRLGAELLERELAAQVLSDGGYAERTFQYHALVLGDALLALELAQARGVEVPSQLEPRSRKPLRTRLGEPLAKMALWLWSARRADESWPLVNDATPQARALAAEALVRAARMQLFSPPASGAAAAVELPATGWTFLREMGCELFFDTGPIGPRDQPGHGHDDALAYELRWYGLPVVTDSGVTSYEDGPVRAFERSAAAHATVSVDGRGVDEIWSAFRVARRGRAEKVAIATISDRRLQALRGRARSYAGFVHERTLIFWPARALLVFDRVRRARAGAQILSHVPLAPEWSAAEASGALYLLGPGARGLQLHCLRGSIERLARGAESPRDGWVGAGFSRPLPRTSVQLRADADGTVLYAIVAPGVTVQKVARGYSLRAPGAEIALDPGLLAGLDPQA